MPPNLHAIYRSWRCSYRVRGITQERARRFRLASGSTKFGVSEKRDCFMQNLPAFNLRKILLLNTLDFRGDYRSNEPAKVYFSPHLTFH